jgi:hypothetical protein
LNRALSGKVVTTCLFALVEAGTLFSGEPLFSASIIISYVDWNEWDKRHRWKIPQAMP